MTIQQRHPQTNVLSLNGGDAFTMTSLDFLNNIINPARADEGEPPLRNTELLRKIEDECDDLPVAEFLQPPKGGTPQRFYRLNIDQMMLIGMRESKVVRRSVLARLKVLGEKVANVQTADQISRKDLALMVIQAEEESERLTAENRMLELQLEETKPVVDAYDRIARAEGSLNLTEAAKALQQPPRKFNQFLCGQHWIYKRIGGKQYLGYQDKVQQGLVEHKVTMVPMADGSERLCEQVRITPKGLTRLAQQLSTGGQNDYRTH